MYGGQNDSGTGFLSQVMQLFCVTVIPPVHHINISFICGVCCVIVAADSVIRYSTSNLRKELLIFIELEAVEPVWAHSKEKSLQPHEKLIPSAPVIQSTASTTFHIDQNIVCLFLWI
jgi:hypothetical protein